MESKPEVEQTPDLWGAVPQKPLPQATSIPKVAYFVKEQDGQDIFYLSTDGHKVGFSARDVVIQHPCDCGFKGSTLDKRKTFHHWPSFMVYVDECKLHMDKEFMDKLEDQYKDMRSHAKY